MLLPINIPAKSRNPHFEHRFLKPPFKPLFKRYSRFCQKYHDIWHGVARLTNIRIFKESGLIEDLRTIIINYYRLILNYYFHNCRDSATCQIFAFWPQDPTGNRYQDIHCMREALDPRVLSPRRNPSKSYK